MVSIGTPASSGNIHCTGGTIKWLEQRLQMIGSPDEAEELAVTGEDNGGVYVVPAFAGLGAPWWQGDIKAAILGMTLGTGKPHVLRAALESIAYQVNDLVKAMTTQAGIKLKEIRVDGQSIKVFQLSVLFFRKIFKVGQVSHIADTET